MVKVVKVVKVKVVKVRVRVSGIDTFGSILRVDASSKCNIMD